MADPSLDFAFLAGDVEVGEEEGLCRVADIDFGEEF